MPHGRPDVLSAGPTVLLAPPRGERKGEVQSDDRAGLGFAKLKKLRDELIAAKTVSQLGQLAVADLGSPERLLVPLGPARPVDRDDLHGTMVAVFVEHKRFSCEATAPVLASIS